MTDMKLKVSLLSDSLTGLLALSGGVLIWFLLSHNPAQGMVMDVPGTDGTPSSAGIPLEQVVIGEYFTAYDGVPSTSTASWPGFRGPGRDNFAADALPIDDGILTLWTIPLGEGHAGAAIHGGKAFVLDYDEDEQADALRCFSLADGREIWRRQHRRSSCDS